MVQVPPLIRALLCSRTDYLQLSSGDGLLEVCLRNLDATSIRVNIIIGYESDTTSELGIGSKSGMLMENAYRNPDPLRFWDAEWISGLSTRFLDPSLGFNLAKE